MLLLRGISFYFAKYIKRLSFIKTENIEELKYINKLASKVYISLGGIYFAFILVLFLCFPLFFNRFGVFTLLFLILIDYFSKVLIDIRIKIDNQLKIWEEEDKLKESNKIGEN